MGFGDVKTVSISGNADFSYSSKDISVDSVNTNSFNMNSVVQADQKNYTANSMNKNVIEELDLSADTKNINNNTPMNAPTNSNVLENNTNAQNTNIFSNTTDNTNTPQDILNNQNTDNTSKTIIKLSDSNTNNNNGNVNAKTDINMGTGNNNSGKYAYANPNDVTNANGIGGNTNGDNDSKTGVTALGFNPMGLNPDLKNIIENSKNVHSTGENIVNKNEFNTESFDLNSVTAADIQKMVGKLSYTDYKDFVDGVEKYYENQEDYLNKLLYGADGSSGYKGLLDEINYKLDMTEDLYKQDSANYTYQLHSEWELTPELKNSGKTFDEFMAMGYQDQLDFIGDKNEVMINVLAEKKALEDNYNKGVRDNYMSYGFTTMDDLLNFRDELQIYVDDLDGAIKTTENNRDSAKFDYIYFMDDYQNYEFKTEFTEDEISTLLCCVGSPGEFYYAKYHEQYPDVSLLEFVLMTRQVSSDAFVYDLNGNTVINDGDTPGILDMADISSISPQLAKTYQYYLENDPEMLDAFFKDCEYEINQLKGQIAAEDYLGSLYEVCSEDGFTLDVCKGIANELGVAWEGALEGVKTFGEGLVYILEAVFTAFGAEENRSYSVDEYKKMYIMQALLSEEDKIAYGLVKYDDDGNLVNVNPNCPIDFTKDYNGGILDVNYQFTQGIGNMAPSIAISLVNPVAGSVAFGASAGGNAYHASMVEGNSYMASLGYAIFTGSSEAITQRMLGGIPGLSDAEVTSFKTYLQSVSKEAFQESFQAGMDYIYKASFMGYELPTTEEGWKAIADDILTQGAYGAATAGFLNCKPGVQINFKDGNVNTNTGTGSNTGVDVDTDTNTGDFDEDINISDINNTRITELEKSILSKVDPDMSQIEKARLLYYELGRKVEYSEYFKYAKDFDSKAFNETYEKHMTFDDIADDNSIICVHWAQLYAKTLIDAGFDESQIVVQRIKNSSGNYSDGSHAGIYVVLDDGTIIMPDLTAPLGAHDDAYNVKMNNETTGFLVFTPEQINDIVTASDNYDAGVPVDSNSEISKFVYSIKEYEADSAKYYTFSNEDTKDTARTNLTNNQQKFLNTVGEFLFASEGSKETQKARVDIEEEMFKYMRKENSDILKQADTKIEDIKTDTSNFISETDKLDVESDAAKNRYKYDVEELTIDSTFLGLDKINTENMITVRNYMVQQVKSSGLSLNDSGDGVVVGRPIQVVKDGETKTITSKIQFTSDGAIVPMTIYKEGKIVAEYTVTMNSGNIDVRKSTPLYTNVMNKLANKGISLDERKIYENILPTMTNEEIMNVANDLYSEGKISSEYVIKIDNDEITIIPKLGEDS